MNLVGNAVKFTDARRGDRQRLGEPGATPTARIELHFAVRDTGIGIPADRVGIGCSSSFSQVDASTTRALRRHRPRPRDLPAARRADGRPHLGRERASARARRSTSRSARDRGGRRCRRGPRGDRSRAARASAPSWSTTTQATRWILDAPAAARGAWTSARLAQRPRRSSCVARAGRRSTSPCSTCVIPELDGIELAQSSCAASRGRRAPDRPAQLGAAPRARAIAAVRLGVGDLPRRPSHQARAHVHCACAGTACGVFAARRRRAGAARTRDRRRRSRRPLPLRILLAEDNVRQPEGRAQAARARGGYRADVAGERARGPRSARARAVRRRPDGRADAGDGRARGDAAHPRASARRRTRAVRHRDDRQRDAARIARPASPRAWTTT